MELVKQKEKQKNTQAQVFCALTSLESSCCSSRTTQEGGSPKRGLMLLPLPTQHLDSEQRRMNPEEETHGGQANSSTKGGCSNGDNPPESRQRRSTDPLVRSKTIGNHTQQVHNCP